MITKVCSQCGIAKPLASFYKDASKSDGLRPNCKACHLSRGTRYRDKQANTEYMREYREKKR